MKHTTIIARLTLGLFTSSVVAGARALIQPPVVVHQVKGQGAVSFHGKFYVLLDIYEYQGDQPLFGIRCTDGLRLVTADDLRAQWSIWQYEVPAVNIIKLDRMYAIWREDSSIRIY